MKQYSFLEESKLHVDDGIIAQRINYVPSAIDIGSHIGEDSLDTIKEKIDNAISVSEVERICLMYNIDTRKLFRRYRLYNYTLDQLKREVAEIIEKLYTETNKYHKDDPL